MTQQDNSPPQRQSLLSVFRSVSASMFGVQSSEKHAEDFSKGSAKAYIVVGLIVTILFIFAVWGVVKLVVSVAQPG
jgi:flagellar biogenesis protein FliO